MGLRDLDVDDPYYGAWHEYRHTRKRSALISIAAVGGGWLMAALVDGFGGPGWLFPIILAAAVTVVLLAGQLPIWWPCPRCDKPFFATSWGHNALAWRCLHCGLQKWAPRDPEIR